MVYEHGVCAFHLWSLAAKQPSDFRARSSSTPTGLEAVSAEVSLGFEFTSVLLLHLLYRTVWRPWSSDGLSRRGMPHELIAA